MGVLSNVGAVPGGKPFEPFGKDSICSEGGSRGRRTDWPCHINIAKKVKLLRPSVQLPAGIHGCAVYKDFEPDGKLALHAVASLIATLNCHPDRFPLQEPLAVNRSVAVGG